MGCARAAALRLATRPLEMLPDRFGAFEAVAYSTIKLAKHQPEQELSMDLLVAEAVPEFPDNLRTAGEAVEEWDRHTQLHES